MTYAELKQKQQQEVNEFPLGFAFSNDQFSKMMDNWGLNADKKEDIKKIVSIGAGGYVQIKDIPSMNKMFRRHKKELREFRKNKNELKKAILHEMFNIEYEYSHDDEHLCNNLGVNFNDFKKDTELQKLFNEVENEYHNSFMLNR